MYSAKGVGDCQGDQHHAAASRHCGKPPLRPIQCIPVPAYMRYGAICCSCKRIDEYWHQSNVEPLSGKWLQADIFCLYNLLWYKNKFHGLSNYHLLPSQLCTDWIAICLCSFAYFMSCIWYLSSSGYLDQLLILAYFRYWQYLASLFPRSWAPTGSMISHQWVKATMRLFGK